MVPSFHSSGVSSFSYILSNIFNIFFLIVLLASITASFRMLSGPVTFPLSNAFMAVLSSLIVNVDFSPCSFICVIPFTLVIYVCCPLFVCLFSFSFFFKVKYVLFGSPRVSCVSCLSLDNIFFCIFQNLFMSVLSLCIILFIDF